jgi:Kef-type K+ transport system membrane component KefB
MTGVWALAALWLGLALVAGLLSIWLWISTALSEIVVGTIAQLIIGAVVGSAVLGTNESWVQFLSGIGAIVLTFLAGAELDPVVFKLKIPTCSPAIRCATLSSWRPSSRPSCSLLGPPVIRRCTNG